MVAELEILAYAALFQGVQFAMASVASHADIGSAKNFSPRDLDKMGKPLGQLLSTKPARIYRAFGNHFEALILFTISVVVVTLSGSSSAFTLGCAWVFLACRIIYFPAYYFGLSPWRSVIWSIGFVATMLMLLAAVV